MHRALLPRLYRCTTILAVAGSAAIAACSDDRPVPPTAPPALDLVSSEPLCSNQLAKQLTAGSKLLKTAKDQTEANKRLKEITMLCIATSPSSLQLAVEKLISYFDFFLAAKADPARGLTGTNVDWAAHFNAGLLYTVGRVEGPDTYGGVAVQYGVTPEAFTDGAIGVCNAAGNLPGCSLTTGTGWAGLTAHAGWVGKPKTKYDLYLLTITQLKRVDCYRENLRDDGGLCYDYSVNPYTTFTGTTDPLTGAPLTGWVTLGICTDKDNHSFHENVRGSPPRALAHLTPSETDDPSFIELAQPDGTLEDPLLGCATANDPVAMLPGSGGAFAAAMSRIGRVASKGWSLLGPKPAYALDTQSGSVRAFTSFGGVIAQVFFESWDARSTPLNLTSIPNPRPAEDNGTWEAFATSPGSAIVQPSFDGIQSNIVVLAQGGGACANNQQSCGGLTLTGKIGGATPVNGIYRVEWTAVEGSPTVKAAPFKILAADSSSTIAVLEYISVQSANRFRLTTAHGVDTLGTWVRNRPQKFEFTIVLTPPTPPAVRTVHLSVTPLDPNAPDAPPAFSAGPYGFANAAATSLKYIMADFSFIDAGTVGWENIRIFRLPDPLQ